MDERRRVAAGTDGKSMDEFEITLGADADSLSPEQLDQAVAHARVVVNGRHSAEARSRVAAQLAEASLVRRFDLEVPTGGGAFFERSDTTLADVVSTYERALAELESEREDMVVEVRGARHSLLVNRDHVVGTEAEVGRINRDIVRLSGELLTAKKRIRALTNRRKGLTERVVGLQSRLSAAQQRNQALRSELDQRIAAGVPLSRRIARRLRGGRG